MSKKSLIYLICLLVIIIFLFLVLISFITRNFIKNSNNKSKNEVISIETTDAQKKEMAEASKTVRKEILADSSEQKRIEQYATEFIRYLEGRNITSAYNKLNEDFKKNYFNTQEAFNNYIEKYFPKLTSTKYKNMERLGDLYVLEVEIKDIMSKDPNDFNFYIVIKENDYDDYEISFSVDKPMNKYEEEEK